MLSKNKIKSLKAYHLKKNRDEQQVFIVEGNKIVEEALALELSVEVIVATHQWISTHSVSPSVEVIEAELHEIKKISCLTSATEVWALVNRPQDKQIPNSKEQTLTLALDSVQDPGNMGTILRTAEWFGVSKIVCSFDCVDIYNPKVVQASMGSVLRVPVEYLNLPTYIQEQEVPVYGAFLEGENIYNATLPKDAIVVMGNEGKGISKEVSACITKKILIPSAKSNNSESLNVAIATSIICSEFFRR